MAGTRDKVIVSTYTNGILDPNGPMLGPVRDGGVIEANTMPGCWGPMITPHLRGGHEVTQPVAVENAEPGDAVAIKIRDHPGRGWDMSSLIPSLEDLFHKSVKVRICPYGDCKASQHFLPELVVFENLASIQHSSW